MSSDVCKHCTHAACLDVCPTGALFRTEFGTVVVQQDVCNGCGYCVPACPFGVIGRRETDELPEAENEDVLGLGTAHKCTLCYDRLKDGMEPACAQACPTDSIQFGPLEELRERAQQRVERLHEQGVAEAELYGESPDDGVGGFGAFFLLLDKPEVYGLPPDPIVPTRRLPEIWGAALPRRRRPRRQRPGGRRRREPMSTEPGAAGPDGSGYRSYYGKPIIKEPVWEPVIPAYFFFGGTAGAAASLGLAARLSGNPALARTATYVDAVAIGVSPALLIIDLGRPERFLNMLRMFKVTSPMSVGTWIVTFSGLASGLATSLEVIGRLPRAKLVAEAAAGALGPFLSTYTAALLADTAVPVWHEARRELPFVFAGSSAASAGAACALHRATAQRAAPPAGWPSPAPRSSSRPLGSWSAASASSPSPTSAGAPAALATAAKALTAAGALTMLLQGRRRGGARRGRRAPAGGLARRALRHLPRGPRVRQRPAVHDRPPATARGPARGDARLMPVMLAWRAVRGAANLRRPRREHSMQAVAASRVGHAGCANCVSDAKGPPPND